jgi:hypothetical protein
LPIFFLTSNGSCGTFYIANHRMMDPGETVKITAPKG